MIDKLDSRVSPQTQLQSEVHDYIRSAFGEHSSRVKHSRLYSGIADLRPIGRDAILHLNCKFGNRNHKFEILDVGKKGYNELFSIGESVFRADPRRFEIMRIDLTADVADIPVSWFQQHARVKHKRFATEHGVLKYERFGRGTVETIGAGKRPNLVRVYDKVAESEMQFRRMERAVVEDSEPLDFEKAFGFGRDSVLTRVERQCGGGRIPEPIKTFGDLHKAANLDPFDMIEIFDSGVSRLPTIEECADASEYFKGIGMRHVALEMGMHDFRRYLNKHTGGNAARQFERYAQFFPSDHGKTFTSKDLCAIYRESTTQQLAA